MAAVTLLSAHKLCKSFGGVAAVHKVDFDLAQNETRAIIGPNGAGKTTFVNLLCGRIKVDDGTVHFAGHDITNLPMHRRVRLGIAYTFQITSIFPNLTVLENAAIAAQNRIHNDSESSPQIHRDAAADHAESSLQKVGLDGLQNRRAGALAYGHQRLLEVAMGLALNPRLLILDEPTQGLSDGEIERFCEVVGDAARDATVLLIEHNIAVVMALAERITVFDNGQILAHGAPQEIRENADVQAAYLGK